MSKNTTNVEAIYPLSPMQEGLLFHSLYAPRSEAYFIQFNYTFRGRLDVSAFKQAWQRVVERHAVLRTLFTWERSDKMFQVVRGKIQLPWQDLDWRGVPLDEQEIRLQRFLEEDRARGFDLAQAPLMRLTLIRSQESAYDFVVDIHHLLLDGWSVALVLNEVFAFYEAFRKGQDVRVEPARPYRDYIQWLQRQDTTAAESYWRETLSGFTRPTPLNFGRAVVREEDETTHGYGEQELQLSEETTGALQMLARRHRLTLNSVMQGAWALLLSRYSGESDVVYGAVMSGRPAELAGVEAMVGLFINTLPVRVRVDGGQKVVEWLQGLQAEQVEMRRYEYSPLSQVQRWSEVPDGVSLFESLYAFVNYPVDASEVEGESELEIDMVNSVDRTTYPLNVEAFLRPNLTWKVGYDSRRFDDATIGRMLGHLRTLLEAIVLDPQQSLDALPLLTEAESRQLLVEWNDTRSGDVDPRCLHQLFAEQAERTPDNLALVYEGEQLSYRELNSRANRLARHLQTLGVGPEVLVGLCAERSIEMVVGLLGILKAGGAYVPLDPSYPLERLAFMLEDARAPVVLTQRHLADGLKRSGRHVLSLDADGETFSAYGDANPACDVGGDNLAYAIFTSGSTGKPKCVTVCHRSAVNLLAALDREIYAGEDASPLRVSLNGPPAFDTSVKQLLQLMRGHTLHIVPHDVRLDADALLSFIRTNRLDVLDCTPSQLKILLSSGLLSEHESVPRRVLIGGEAIDDATWQTLAGVEGKRFYNLYGPTECAADSTVSPIRGDRANIGRPVVNTQVYLLDRKLRPVPVGVPGGLYIGGAGVARGYFGRPELTAQRFIPHPFSSAPGERLYKTGDLARYRSDGQIEYLGRADNQVKVRGHRVELEEIEQSLAGHKDVRETVVTLREDTPGHKRLVAYVVPTPARAATYQGRERYRLPNNLAVVHLNKNETDHLYREVFERDAYSKHGIKIHDGDCVFDVGANVGFFTLFAHRSGRNVKVYAFDPNPYVFEVLRLNTELYGVNAELFECGLSNQAKPATYTFYPKFSQLSGLYADADEDREVVRSFIRNQQERRAGAAVRIDIAADGQVGELIEELLDERFESQSFGVEVRRLSDIIREKNVSRIDLLKINVEKSELDVLEGIDEQDWKKIQQIILELHNIEGRLEIVTDLLRRHDYSVVVEKDWSLERTSDSNYYLYATRGSRDGHSSNGHSSNGKNVASQRADVLQFEEPFLTPGELQDFLKQQLPEYMIPSAFVLLDTLPLSPNGKIDRRALPPPGDARPSLDSHYDEPRTPVEQTLVEIWAQVLGVGKVGVNDNFFELGGDSILSIQIIARANRGGLRLTPKQLFDHPTVAGLAAMAGAEAGAKAEQGLVTGDAPLTPIQRLFFEWELAEPHHFNQAVMLKLKAGTDAARLRQSLQHLLRHHDALRMRYRQEDGSWRQFNAAEETLSWETVSLVHLTSGEQRTAAIEAEAARAQKRLDLATGPLVRAVHFELGEGEQDRLLIVIHHLCVDGVSWRILLEDLELAYGQSATGRGVSLPEKTTSYKRWAEELVKAAQSAPLRDELSYWTSRAWEQARPLPVDRQGGGNLVSEARSIETALSSEETDALLRRVPEAYQTQINEVLLTALGRAMRKWGAAGKLVVEVEGHGREEIGGGGVDVTRTVGWFTSVYPVLIGGREGEGIGEELKRVKEEMRGVPRRGMGYGVLRYLSEDAEVREEMRRIPRGELSFNYLGQFGQSAGGNGITEAAEESVGPLQSERGTRRYLMTVNCMVTGERLNVIWTYGESLYRPETVERLAENYLESLRELIAHCLSPESGGYTASDFPLSRLNEEKLGKLSALLSGLSDED